MHTSDGRAHHTLCTPLKEGVSWYVPEQRGSISRALGMAVVRGEEPLDEVDKQLAVWRWV